MTTSTKEATEAEMKRRQEIYDRRKKEIIFHIENYPGQSQYKISKELKIPRASLGRMLEDLIQEKQIKFEEVTKGKRRQYQYYIMKITDFTWDFFSIGNFDASQKMGRQNRTLALSTLSRGIPVTIEMDDGSEQSISSVDEFNELLQLSQSM